MALNNDAKFEQKMTFTFKNDMRNLRNFHQKFSPKFSLLSKVENVMTMEKDAKLEEELTCHFKIDMRTLMNFDPST